MAMLSPAKKEFIDREIVPIAVGHRFSHFANEALQSTIHKKARKTMPYVKLKSGINVRDKKI